MRLFIALPLPDKARTLLGRMISQFRPLSHSVKWVEADIIHLTVKFLGETGPELMEPIKRALDRVGPNYKAIACDIDRPGAFPNLKRPRVFWAGLTGELETLANLAKHVDLEMNALGFEKESRPFKAHLTLGRVKQYGRMDELCRTVETFRLTPEPVSFSEIVLYQSTLTPHGPIYDSLHRVSLGS